MVQIGVADTDSSQFLPPWSRVHYHKKQMQNKIIIFFLLICYLWSCNKVATPIWVVNFVTEILWFGTSFTISHVYALKLQKV